MGISVRLVGYQIPVPRSELESNSCFCCFSWIINMTIESVSFCGKVAEAAPCTCLSVSVFPLTTFPISSLHTNTSLLESADRSLTFSFSWHTTSTGSSLKTLETPDTALESRGGIGLPVRFPEERGVCVKSLHLPDFKTNKNYRMPNSQSLKIITTVYF